MKHSHEYEIISKNPIVYLWDSDNNVVRAKIVGCDFDKYVDLVDDNGKEIIYKWGYVYNTYEDAFSVKDHYSKPFSNCEDYEGLPECIDVHKLLLSNKNYALWKKAKRKESKKATKWYVYIGDESYCTAKKFKRFIDAFKYFKQQDDTTDYCLGENNTGLYDILEVKDGVLYYDSDSKRVVKSRYLGKRFGYKALRKYIN